MNSPRFRGDYALDWRELSRETRALVGNRCVRCFHPFDANGKPMLCDEQCDRIRGRQVPISMDRTGWTDQYRTAAHLFWVYGLNFGIHHLDGNKENNRWWNLLPLCNSCHLTVQARVIPERPWLLTHSDWFKPYVAGFYAFYYGRLELDRAAVEADLHRFLAMGQPWLYAEVPVA